MLLDKQLNLGNILLNAFPLMEMEKLILKKNHANPALEMIIPEAHGILRGCYQWSGPLRGVGGEGGECRLIISIAFEK